MNTGPVKAAEHIRLVFELWRADHPRLFDDLIRFQKGTKRINRLRVLAHDGLLVQGARFLTVFEGAEQAGSIVGRCRVPPDSVLNVSDVDTASSLVILRERHPRLPWPS